jgi:hypothetical protein
VILGQPRAQAPMGVAHLAGLDQAVGPSSSSRGAERRGDPDPFAPGSIGANGGTGLLRRCRFSQ